MRWGLEIAGELLDELSFLDAGVDLLQVFNGGEIVATLAILPGLKGFDEDGFEGGDERIGCIVRTEIAEFAFFRDR